MYFSNWSNFANFFQQKLGRGWIFKALTSNGLWRLNKAKQSVLTELKNNVCTKMFKINFCFLQQTRLWGSHLTVLDQLQVRLHRLRQDVPQGIWPHLRHRWQDLLKSGIFWRFGPLLWNFWLLFRHLNAL